MKEMLSVLLSATLAQPSSGSPSFWIGHSLMSDIPDMVNALTGGGMRFRHQDIPGAPLRWQWEEATRKSEFEPQFQGRYHTNMTKEFKVLVMVDSVPRGDAASISESTDFAGRFLSFARRQNPSVRAFYYEPWHDLKSGTPQRGQYDTSSPSRGLTWRPRIKEDRAKWDKVVAEANKKNPGQVPLKLIPVATGLGMAYDAIQTGRLPGLKRIEDLFSDEIHLNPLGKYFSACIHYRALFGGKVSGKPYDIKNRWGRPYFDEKDWTGRFWAKPSPATVKALQELADQVAL